MIIRLATVADLPEAFERFTAFEACSSFVKVVPSVCVANYTRFIQQGFGGLILAVADGQPVGGLGYIITNDLHSGAKYAVETFWLMLPEHRGAGLQLLDAFEGIAKDHNCDECAMIHLQDSFPKALSRLYTQRGYRLVEQHFMKRLRP